MEVDLLDAAAVHLGLGSSQPGEEVTGRRPAPRREATRLDDGSQIGEPPGVSIASTCSSSSEVVVLPRLNRTVPIPSRWGTPMAARTGESSTEPAWHADPVVAATPASRARTSAPTGRGPVTAAGWPTPGRRPVRGARGGFGLGLVTGAALARTSSGEVCMQAVMVRIVDMSDGTSGVEHPGASLADRAMDRYAAGEEAAFGELYDELAPRLFRFALRWTGNRSAAEDAVQQTLLQIHCASHRFVRGGAVLPWAYAIARRLLIDLGRRGAREARLDDDVSQEEAVATPSADEALHWKRVGAEARRELAVLPAAWREPFELVKFEGLSVAEAAEVLGITRGMVKIRTHRATAALRKAMARRLRSRAERAGGQAIEPRIDHPREGGVPI